MRKTIIAAVVALALMVGVVSTAAADGLQLFSGRTMEKGMAFNFSVGAPDASFMFVGALTKDFDLGGILRLGYLNPVGFGAGGFWMEIAATARYTIFDRGSYNLAIRGDLGPVFNIVNNYIADAFMGGFTLAPYVLIGIPLKDVVSINVGAGLPIILLFRDGVTIAEIPIAFVFGAEVFIQKNLTFNFNAEMGPGIWVCTTGGATTNGVQFYGLFKVGITYGF
jgi:hypothetical protein